MKIAILSLADINNYGDVFFPYVFRKEIKKRIPNAEIDLVTNMVVENELYQTVSYSLSKMKKYDAIILAGGETVQRLDDKIWNDVYCEKIHGKPTDIVFEWLSLERCYKAFFAVGVHPCMLEHKNDIDYILTHLNYLSVRGEISKKIIENSLVSNYGNINIVPDLGWLFGQYIDELERQADKTKMPKRPYMIFQMFNENDYETVKYAARKLGEFQDETGVGVVLLPIVQTKSRDASSSWNDYSVLQKLQEESGNSFELMPDLLNVPTIGMLIRNAKFYLGGSMHGAVTSLVYGRPAGNILTWTAPKLQDLHGQRMRTDCFINQWGKMPKLLQTLNHEAESAEAFQYNLSYSKYMQYRLSINIDILCNDILKYIKESK